MKKISYIANTFLTLCVIGLLFVFYHYGVTLMVNLSIPILIMYGIYYAVIAAKRIDVYFWLVYATIGIYMCVATICLGINYGFNLYCMSLIPIGFFCQYLGSKITDRTVKTGYSSIFLIALYFISVGIVMKNGPLYSPDKSSEIVFYLMNSLFVFSFLVFYSNLLVNMVTITEKRLEYIALYDNLTGLYNRHRLMDLMNEMVDNDGISWISILDVDKFKSINDKYGHSAGDEVLKYISVLMKETCPDCHIGRWGGEEFIIVPCKSTVDQEIIETLRKKIEDAEASYGDIKINMTISAGVSRYTEVNDIEKCIQMADARLYRSKESGRNRVTFD